MFVHLVSTFVLVCGRGQKSDLFLPSLQDFAVFSFTQLLGETLHELDLTSCTNLTDLSVCSIAAHLRNLVVLRLARCKQITDWGLLGVVEATKNNAEQEMVRPCCGGNMKWLNIRHFCCLNAQQGDKGPRFTGTFGIMGFFKPPCLPFEERPKVVTQSELDQFRHHPGASFLALSRLQELDLSACPKLTDSSITQVGLWCCLQKSKSESTSQSSTSPGRWYVTPTSTLYPCPCCPRSPTPAWCLWRGTAGASPAWPSATAKESLTTGSPRPHRTSTGCSTSTSPVAIMLPTGKSPTRQNNGVMLCLTYEPFQIVVPAAAALQLPANTRHFQMQKHHHDNRGFPSVTAAFPGESPLQTPLFDLSD